MNRMPEKIGSRMQKFEGFKPIWAIRLTLSVSQGRLFGTNGIRFVPGVSRDLDFVVRLGEAVGTYFAESDVLVGQDGRLSSPALSYAAISGLMSSGRDVGEAGLVPTPALQYAVKILGFKGGVMITASHNPPQYNGLKVVGADGVEIPRLDEQRIEKVFSDGTEAKADWRSVGTSRQEPSVVNTYIEGVSSRVNVKQISERKFTMVMDLGNGAQCVAAPYLVESMGCKLITLNSVVDGTFPGRGPEPTPETLRDLSLAVKAVGADLGVAYDGDGDRAMFCDEAGNVLWGDQTGCLLADYLLERSPNGTVVTPVSSSQAIEGISKKRGAKVLRTRVGSVDVSRAILERKALFGFEENGGCIYPPHMAVRDGGMTTALLLECLSSRGMSFSKAMSYWVPRFHQAKAKLPVDSKKVDAIMKKVEREAHGEVEKIDGLKIWLDDHSWVLVRASGTEPVIRIFAESETRVKVDSIIRKYAKIVTVASA